MNSEPKGGYRWRKLEGSDPATYELIQKLQLLQRRLIHASEQLVERDLQIREKEALCTELQTVLARAPGPEATEKLALCKVCLHIFLNTQLKIRKRNWNRNAHCALKILQANCIHPCAKRVS